MILTDILRATFVNNSPRENTCHEKSNSLYAYVQFSSSVFTQKCNLNLFNKHREVLRGFLRPCRSVDIFSVLIVFTDRARKPHRLTTRCRILLVNTAITDRVQQLHRFVGENACQINAVTVGFHTSWKRKFLVCPLAFRAKVVPISLSLRCQYIGESSYQICDIVGCVSSPYTCCIYF